MSRVIPNTLGESLERSSANLLDMIINKRQFELREREIAQNARRIDLEERRQDSGERANALSRMINIAPFLPEDVPIAQIEFLHDDLELIYPEFDPRDPNGFGGMPLNKQTYEGFLQGLTKEAINSLPPEQRDRLMGMLPAKALLGTAATGAELEARETGAQVVVDAYTTLSKDPKALDGMYRNAVGLQQPIRLNIDGREVVFDTSQSASLTVGLMQHRDAISMEWTRLNSKESSDFAGELMGQMEGADINLGRQGAERVVRTYNQAAVMASEGTLTDENNPVLQFMNNPDVSPEMKAAMQVFSGADSMGQQSRLAFLENSPGGQQVLRTIAVSGALKEAGFPDEEILPMTAKIAEWFPGQMPNIDPSRFFGGANMELTQPIGSQGQSGEGDQSLITSNAGPTVDALTLQVIKDVVGSGAGTREQAVAKYGEAAVAQALGGSSQSVESVGAGGSFAPRDTSIEGAIRESRQEIVKLQEELEAFMAPVKGRPQAQITARSNSPKAKSIRESIAHLEKRITDLERR